MHLIGLDFGSTTTSALVASAKVLLNCVTGRRELSDVRIVYRGEPVFTPLAGESLDEAQLSEILDQWIAASGVPVESIAGGGAIVTGLAAQRANAGCIRRLVRKRFGDALIATADDPLLESWLAFMGNCLEISRSHPDTWFINVDIGGGTTNLALGQGGEVSSAGCYFIGARHVQFVPGTYKVAGFSSYGRRLFDQLAIRAEPGDDLNAGQLATLLDFYVHTLEALVAGEEVILALGPARGLQQAAFRPPKDLRPAITFSGGVGELVYRHAQGLPLPGTTHYGDLGIDLARRIVESPALSTHLSRHVPTTLGRATAYGLTVHNTEISGATLFLPRSDLLPLPDVPIVGRLSAEASDAELAAAVEIARTIGHAACLQVELPSASLACVQPFGKRLALALRAGAFPTDRPLVLLVSQNVGKTLGQIVTDWGCRPYTLIVLDEVPNRKAHYVGLGRPAEGTVPLSFFGWE